MKKNVWVTLLSLGLMGVLVGCGTQNQKSNTDPNPVTQEQKKEEIKEPQAATSKLIGLADLVPHNDLIQQVTPILKEKGIEIEIVSTASDATWLDKLNNGEVDFAFFAHWPYVEEYNETNGATLQNAGNIHVEPIAAYSTKYTKVEEVPDNGKFIVPNDATNEYRALKIIEDAGFIKLNPELKELKASVKDIVEYVKPIEIVEVDAHQIIGLAQDFDVYITNTNKALEAGIDTTKYLFRETSDSPYANIMAVKEEKLEDPNLKALAEALRSEATKAFIEEKYNGAVIPAK